jgi:hypothetical protein
MTMPPSHLCPECSSPGPHDDNHVPQDSDLFALLCTIFGTQWNPNDDGMEI